MTAIDNPGGDEVSELKRRIRQLETQSALPPGVGGDGDHAGSGAASLQLGPDADAAGNSSVALGEGAVSADYYTVAIGDYAAADLSDGIAIGRVAHTSEDGAIAIGYSSGGSGEESISIGYLSDASAYRSVAFGRSASASHDNSVAIGQFAFTSAANQIKLGTSSDTVVVPGTFSNPSARHLKQNIIPAPSLSSIFPELVEYEYIDAAGKRRLGYIADDLIGTDAERFVTLDDDGAPAGIDYLGLLVAQVAQLSAELAALKNNS